MLEKLRFRKKSLVERWTDQLLGNVEDAAEGLERTTDRAKELVGVAGRKGGAYLREAGERARDVGERAWDARGDVIEAGGRIGGRARAGARASRDALAARVESIASRAAEIREERRRHRAKSRRALERLRAERRRGPVRLDVRSEDRVVLRGRRPVDLRLPDGGLVRYRYYERPGFWQRLYLNLTGRRVWPR